MSVKEQLEERRRKLFKQMDWLFVILPPLLAMFVGAVGGFFVALVIPIPETSFWGRWLIGFVGILGIPTIGYGLKLLFERNR